MSVCETCVHQNNGRVLRTAEARIHKDNNPDHHVVDIEKAIDEDKEQNGI